MKCPTCGNELDPNEVFCGQCGAPTRPTGMPTEMVQTPPMRSGQLNSPYNTQLAPGTGNYNTGAPSTAYPAGAMPPNPNQSAIRPSGPQQQGEFYQDATEAMSVLPNNGPSYPAGYPQQGYGGTPVASQFGQPVPPTNFAPPSFPSAPVYQPGQPYGSRPGMTPPPKRGNNAVMIIAIICLACAIIAVSSFGILYLVHKNNARTVTTPTATATTAPSPSPTPSPSPSPTVTPSPSPTTTPSPTITPSPTATPDSGFSFCGTACITNGFQVESPNGWQQSAPNSTAIEFNDPQQTDAYAIFKTPGATSSDAITLIKNDLTNYASNPGYTAPTSTSSMNIGGESWTYETASYQLNGATEQVQIYATVHGGNAYITELQWPASQATTYYTGFFQPMLNSFKFQ
ncbi:MAG TPA: zinc-ribbon domain-containing protein [Ktedonobacteraceae bacterium]|nr:zinc-ribbon domain-containing protein [Ktedonobacteraceae bacterium]